ncbi:MAG: hypothetical protein O3C21_15680, partial [Verrucomicrobia bacterium]|nr:hypothetical protein [Verrucomicrobiota bacterium]
PTPETPNEFGLSECQFSGNELADAQILMLKKLLAGLLKVWKLPHFSLATHFSEALLFQDFIYHGLRNFQNWR